MYLRKTVKTPCCIFRYHYYSSRYGKKSKREKNTLPSSECQKAINKRIASHKRLWLICRHFKQNDYFLTFTYRRRDRPGDINKAVKLMGKALSKLARMLKKKGIKLTYFHVCERGERGGIHHHVLIKNRFQIGELFNSDIWQYGKIMFELVYSKSVLKIAEYFIKGDSDKSEKRYTQSRDLIIPKPRTEIIKADSWNDKPRGMKGYNIINISDGIDSYSGKIYQEYILVKKEKCNGIENIPLQKIINN